MHAEPREGGTHPEIPPASGANSDGGFVRRALIFLLIVQFVLVYLDVTVTFYGASDSLALQDLCSLVIEGSLGGWFSSALTLLVGVAAWLIHRREPPRHSSEARFPGWGLIAAFFAFMALDDGSGLHEALGTAFEDAYASSSRGVAPALLHSFPSYPWQILFGPFLAAGGVFTAWWSARTLPRRGPRILVGLGLGCLVFAVGLDFLEGLPTLYDDASRALRLDEITLPHFSGVVEECSEMLGTGLILTAFGAFLREGLAPPRIESREP